MLTIEEFCDLHNACEEGRAWALKNCTSMQEVWEKAKPAWMMWVATRRGVLTGAELLMFADYLSAQVRTPLDGQGGHEAMEATERFVQGQAAEKEMIDAWTYALEAALEARSQWLRKNTTPNFNRS